jgi:hypothetical protein
VAFTAIAIWSVSAHDRGCDGNPVPERIKSDCCGEREEHQLKPEQISRGPNGEYIVSFEGNTFVITSDKALPSNDACSHISFPNMWVSDDDGNLLITHRASGPYGTGDLLEKMGRQHRAVLAVVKGWPRTMSSNISHREGATVVKGFYVSSGTGIKDTREWVPSATIALQLVRTHMKLRRPNVRIEDRTAPTRRERVVSRLVV